MLRKLIFAAAAAACFAAAPALAGPWRNYEGYYPVNPDWAYFPPFGYSYAPYADVIVGVPVVTYAPVHVRVYAVPQQPPYYNVPPYVVYQPY
ncbi:MAG: hypothetical protein ACLP8A_03515 [Methylovirgula sp.]